MHAYIHTFSLSLLSLSLSLSLSLPLPLPLSPPPRPLAPSHNARKHNTYMNTLTRASHTVCGAVLGLLQLLHVHRMF